MNAVRPLRPGELLPGLSEADTWRTIEDALKRRLDEVQRLRKVMPVDETLLAQWWHLSSLISGGLPILRNRGEALVLRGVSAGDTAADPVNPAARTMGVSADGRGVSLGDTGRLEGEGPRPPKTNNHYNPHNPGPAPSAGPVNPTGPTSITDRNSAPPDDSQDRRTGPVLSGEDTNRRVILSDAVTALRSLGYRKSEAQSAVDRAEAATPGLDLGALVKASLRSLDINR